MQTDILVYLTTSDGTHVCNAVLVTDYQIVIATVCFMQQNPQKTELFIKIQEVEKLMKIQETMWKYENFYGKYSYIALLTVSCFSGK